MKQLLGLVFLIVFAAAAGFGQKGIDPQTQKIKDETNRNTTRTRESDATRSFDWGKGKTQVRERLANPYKLNSRRDVLIENIVSVLKDRKMLVDEASSRLGEGFIVTQPFVFARGAVITQNELKRYGVVDFADTAWSRGRFVLTIEVQSIDGVQNMVAVNARVEGLAGSGISSEWTSVPSSGVAEDEFLAKLVETVTGVSPDSPGVVRN